jgi:hypothetical protein
MRCWLTTGFFVRAKQPWCVSRTQVSYVVKSITLCFEVVQVLRRLRDECGIDLRCVDASAIFYDGLAGVEDPEDKRKIIGRLFCEVLPCSPNIWNLYPLALFVGFECRFLKKSARSWAKWTSCCR